MISWGLYYPIIVGDENYPIVIGDYNNPITGNPVLIQPGFNGSGIHLPQESPNPIPGFTLLMHILFRKQKTSVWGLTSLPSN